MCCQELPGSLLRSRMAKLPSMVALNREASEAALRAGITAATDVTGFGLLGHLFKMTRASGVSAVVVSYLDGAREALQDGFVKRRHPPQPRLGAARPARHRGRGRAAVAGRRADQRQPAGHRGDPQRTQSRRDVGAHGVHHGVAANSYGACTRNMLYLPKPAYWLCWPRL
jgi:hypothetical protein